MTTQGDGEHVGASGDHPTRRWDDEPGAITALTFARYLTTGPTVAEALRYLVGLLSWPIGATAALVACPQGDDVVICAHFAQPLDTTISTSRIDSARAQVHDAVRACEQGRPVLWTDPDASERIPLAAWPLGPARHPRALVIVLAKGREPSLVQDRTFGVPEALAVYLAGNSAQLGIARHAPSGTPDQVSLTERQTRVLSLMAKGLTMRQISHQIGFSESTARSESLSIYRALGVHDRDTALHEATRLGLV